MAIQVDSTGKCSVNGCAEPAYARTWCRTHYARWQRPDWAINRLRPLLEDGQPYTLQALADKIGVSREQVRKLVNKYGLVRRRR